MPYSGETRTYPNEPHGVATTYHLCDDCGLEWNTPGEAESCCSFHCPECGATHSYEEDALDCCAYYCEECGERHYSADDADECARLDRGDDRDPEDVVPMTYPSEILDTVVEYPIFIPHIPGRPPRLCSVEQELSSGAGAALRLLSDIGICPEPYLLNYSHGGYPGKAIVKGDGSLPANGAEVVYSRFNLSDRALSREFSEAIWRLRELKRQRIVLTNRQAGLHIHISAMGMDGLPESMFGPRQMAALYEIWSFCEDVLFKLGSAGWDSHRGQNYTNPMPKFRQGESLTPGRVVQAVGGNRYFSLNFARLLGAAQACRCGACAVGDWQECNCGALQSGTIEWRVFNASTKPETIHGWLVLAHSITAKAFDYQLGSLPEPNGFNETDSERHPWILSWILNECPMTDVERAVVLSLAKRAPGLVIDWEDFERNNSDWLWTLTDELDDERDHDPQQIATRQQTLLIPTPPAPIADDLPF